MLNSTLKENDSFKFFLKFIHYKLKYNSHWFYYSIINDFSFAVYLRNIYGRTGLRGRGALSRWGPNHFVLVIITRYILMILFTFMLIKYVCIPWPGRLAINPVIKVL